MRALAGRSPYAAEAEDVARFLSDLAVLERASPSTQKQALNALAFFFKHVLGREEPVFNVKLKKTGARVPVVLSQGETRRLFGALENPAPEPDTGNPEDQTGYLMEEAIVPGDGQPTGVPKQYPIAKNKKFPDEDNTITPFTNTMASKHFSVRTPHHVAAQPTPPRGPPMPRQSRRLREHTRIVSCWKTLRCLA